MQPRSGDHLIRGMAPLTSDDSSTRAPARGALRDTRLFLSTFVSPRSRVGPSPSSFPDTLLPRLPFPTRLSVSAAERSGN